MRSKKAFTLIELLVVIAIIALLLSIIMPALGKVKLIAKEVLCKSNIRQYGIATELYTNEQDGYLPNPWVSLYSKNKFSNETQRYCRWHNAEFDLGANAEKKDPADGVRYAGPYWQYLAVTKANVCPTFAMYAKKFAEYHTNHDSSIPIASSPSYSYSMNGYFRQKGFTSQADAKTVRKSAIGNPSEVFLWGEENMWELKDSSGATISGSVLNDNALLISTSANGFGRDSFGTFHQASLKQIETQLPKASGLQGTYNGEGVTNLLMVDGSLKIGTPEDNARYCGDSSGY